MVNQSKLAAALLLPLLCGESNPERTAMPFWGPKKVKNILGPQMSKFLPERLMQVSYGPEHSPFLY